MGSKGLNKKWVSVILVSQRKSNEITIRKLNYLHRWSRERERERERERGRGLNSNQSKIEKFRLLISIFAQNGNGISGSEIKVRKHMESFF